MRIFSFYYNSAKILNNPINIVMRNKVTKSCANGLKEEYEASTELY